MIKMMLMTAAAVCVLGGALAAPRNATDVQREFDVWRARFHKNYASPEEAAQRYSVFQANLERIDALNQGESQTPFGANGSGVTKFADLTPEEFRARYLLPKDLLEQRTRLRSLHATTAHLDHLPQALPVTFDWRDRANSVTPVKDQQQCGSCWAFSATENIESVWAIQGGHNLTTLSVEQIVSCDHKDSGCNGGDLPTAFDYVMQTRGLETEHDYPYTSGGGRTGICKAVLKEELAQVDGWEYATRNKNETAMQVYMYSHAPMAICVDAETWQFYTHGVVRRNCGTQLDHCVQLVGWTTMDGVDAWTVRNSWNTDWGMKGYIYIERNSDLCGIAKEAASTYIRH